MRTDNEEVLGSGFRVDYPRDYLSLCENLGE